MFQIVDDINAKYILYYGYQEVVVGGKKFYEYVGSPTTTKPGDPAPYNAVRVQPPEAAPGQQCYWEINEGRWYLAAYLPNLKDADIQRAHRRAADQDFSAAMKAINVEYSEAERSTWPIQISEAAKVKAGGTSEFLNSVLLPSERVEDLASDILSKSSDYQMKYAVILKARRVAYAEADKATLADAVAEGLPQLALYSLYAKQGT